MATQKEIRFRWLQVLHIVEDWDKKLDPTGRMVMRELDKKFYIKERKIKPASIKKKTQL